MHYNFMNKTLFASIATMVCTIVPLPTNALPTITQNPLPSPFLYTFNVPGILYESGTMAESSSRYFWVNSGAKFIIANGTGQTIQGTLIPDEPWRVKYARTNPLDTGNGYYPQNIFRLVTRNTWKNFSQQIQFKLTNVNITDTPNRDGYSGVLFLNRYHDGANLYYAGLREDGTAVIKKKVGGRYYTMASRAVFTERVYDKWTNPNLIPMNTWMGLKSEVRDLPDGSVSIVLWLDKNNTGAWQKVLSTVDSNGKYGSTSVIEGPAYAGLRTDYLDVQFKAYKFSEI